MRCLMRALMEHGFFASSMAASTKSRRLRSRSRIQPCLDKRHSRSQIIEKEIEVNNVLPGRSGFITLLSADFDPNGEYVVTSCWFTYSEGYPGCVLSAPIKNPSGLWYTRLYNDADVSMS